MTDMFRTEVSNQAALRQVRSPDELCIISIVGPPGGYRFIEEHKVHEPAGRGFEDYWYWRVAQESGIYSSEQQAFDDALKSITWLGKLF